MPLAYAHNKKRSSARHVRSCALCMIFRSSDHIFAQTAAEFEIFRPHLRQLTAADRQRSPVYKRNAVVVYPAYMRISDDIALMYANESVLSELSFQLIHGRAQTYGLCFVLEVKILIILYAFDVYEFADFNADYGSIRPYIHQRFVFLASTRGNQLRNKIGAVL